MPLSVSEPPRYRVTSEFIARLFPGGWPGEYVAMRAVVRCRLCFSGDRAHTRLLYRRARDAYPGDTWVLPWEAAVAPDGQQTRFGGLSKSSVSGLGDFISISDSDKENHIVVLSHSSGFKNGQGCLHPTPGC